MPTTIPYDPSLVLGNIVNQEKLENLTQISKLQAPVDAAEDELNSFISMKRSIDMTIQEMIEMNIDSEDLIKESQQVGQKIQQAAIKFAKTKLDAEKNIQPLKSKISTVNDSVESPIDYNKTQIKKMPLSADSMTMNCQYFAFDQNEQDSSTHAATVAAFVSDSVNEFGDKFSSEAKTSAQSQMNSQHSRHSISGTLVVSIKCTHKEAALLAPFILNVDKGVEVWNQMFPKDKIDTGSPANLAMTQAKQASNGKQNTIELLSGATYGSCFIGMVHTLNTTETSSSQTMYSVAESLQGQFEVGGWFADVSGGFGVDSSFSGSAKNLLSTQNISSHCTLITMGSIASIKSNQVQMAVKGFTNDDAAKNMAALQQMQNETAKDMNSSIASSASNARSGQQMVSLQTAKVQGVLSGLSDIDSQSNKMIDTNSMMDAMEDYINKCLDGHIGVPINYYLKSITKAEITHSWLKKYYPSKFNQAGSIDDSGSSSNSASSSSDSDTDGGGDTSGS
ncbi:hypothetical protein [Flammeovirga pacifica]|uniref:Uncharacterized protein n=1 Tax=Flammeovirga pacifica TaxID=915059 RepID=A0A1S1YSY6_FLAPC|nr:hypothetical protein [Flammeovirga pacifica]OHX63973.1 hypothetical protein NH26_20395 [Flammeovirga pacifica]